MLDLQIGNAGGIATSISLRQDQDMDRLPDFSILMLLDRSADVYMANFARADGWLVKPLDRSASQGGQRWHSPAFRELTSRSSARPFSGNGF